MKKNFYFGKSYSKIEIRFITLLSIVIALVASNRLFRNGDIFIGSILFLIIVTLLLMILGRSSINDYWFIENNKIYYLSQFYPYRRLFLAVFFKSDKHLMKTIMLENIIDAKIVWKEKPLPKYTIPMAICLLAINTKNSETIELNLGLNKVGTIETGEALQYFLDKEVLIKGLNKELMDCFLDPNKRLYDYYINLKK